MGAVEELFKTQGRRLRGVEPGDPKQIDELERLIGRALPGEVRAYLRLAGGNPGNLTFIQTHKAIRPLLSEALAAHRPRRHGSRKKPEHPASKLFFGDASGCQDCGPAYLLLCPQPELPGVEIDSDDPPVAGYDYDELKLLEARFSDYVRRAMPGKAT